MADKQDMGFDAERVASGATAAMMAAAFLIIWAVCWYMRPQPAQAEVFDLPTHASMTAGFSSDVQ